MPTKRRIVNAGQKARRASKKKRGKRAEKRKISDRRWREARKDRRVLQQAADQTMLMSLATFALNAKRLNRHPLPPMPSVPCPDGKCARPGGVCLAAVELGECNDGCPFLVLPCGRLGKVGETPCYCASDDAAGERRPDDPDPLCDGCGR